MSVTQPKVMTEDGLDYLLSSTTNTVPTITLPTFAQLIDAIPQKTSQLLCFIYRWLVQEHEKQGLPSDHRLVFKGAQSTRASAIFTFEMDDFITEKVDPKSTFKLEQLLKAFKARLGAHEQVRSTSAARHRGLNQGGQLIVWNCLCRQRCAQGAALVQLYSEQLIEEELRTYILNGQFITTLRTAGDPKIGSLEWPHNASPHLPAVSGSHSVRQEIVTIRSMTVY